MRSLRPLALLGAIIIAPAARAQLSTPLDSTTLAALSWRSIGPANMMGRVADLAVDAKNHKIFYVASAAGGIWKTINAGTTFFPLFDHEQVVSMGALAIAPSDGNILYAGTGEQNSRNSISPGGGLYKSVDAGRTWKLAGLEATQAIGRIVVHPTDPNIVYVAALGHTWNANAERGLYKSVDGGTTWTMAKFVSDKAGFIDVVMDPRDPNTLYASSWERLRGPYFLKSGGPGSALWKTTDAGATWTEIKGEGWPTQMKGRIGLAIAASNPKVLYANAEVDTNPNPLKKGEKADTSKRQKPNSGVYRSADGGATWTRMYRNEGDARPFYYSQIRADPKNENRIYWMSSVFHFSDDGGKTVRRGALSIHTDWHAMWIDPDDTDHFIIADDGGLAITWDKGGTYTFPNVFAIGQFYAASFDMQKPYRVCGGLQDNGSWCGPSRSRQRSSPTTPALSNADWFNIGSGDGFATAQDPTDPNIIYAESQGGNISRYNIATGARIAIRSGRPGRGPYEDSLVVVRGDTTKPETPEISRALQQVRDKAKLDSTAGLRFNWNTPYFLSLHNPSVVYAGGSKVIKSSDRGDHFHPISPDLSGHDTIKINVSTKTTGGITADATGAETYGTVTALAESPIRPGILWAGTDDGRIWLTRDDGGHWDDLTMRFAGVPKNSWVTRIEASHFDTSVVYVAFDNHQENDFAPYLFVSNDMGKTFASLVNDLPRTGPAFLHVVREDPINRDLLFVGSDVAAYVSTNRGKRWQRFMTNMPTVPVHDLRIHPRDHEIIAATHGRALWIADIGPLEQLHDSVMKQSAYFFPPKAAYQYTPSEVQNWAGNHLFAAENPPYGAELVYRLTSGDAKKDTARITVTNVAGDTIRSFTGPGGVGINRAVWDLRRNPLPLGPAALRDSIIAARVRKVRDDSIKAAAKGTDTTEAARRDSTAARERRAPGYINLRPAEAAPGASETRGGGGGGGGARTGINVEPGDYLVTIRVGGVVMKRAVRVERVGEIIEGTPPPDDDH